MLAKCIWKRGIMQQNSMKTVISKYSRMEKEEHSKESIRYISEKGFAKVEGSHCKLWKKMDYRNGIFFPKADV